MILVEGHVGVQRLGQVVVLHLGHLAVRPEGSGRSWGMMDKEPVAIPAELQVLHCSCGWQEPFEEKLSGIGKKQSGLMLLRSTKANI